MMNKPTQLIYPTVDLFLYDLHESFGHSLPAIHHYRQQFWQKIEPNLDDEKLSQLAVLENPAADYVQLLVKEFTSPLDGYFRALQLGDTYALQVNCSGDYKDPETKQPNDATQRIETLSKLKKIIASHINHQLDTWDQELKLQSYEIRNLVASVRTLSNPIHPQGLNLKELQSTLIKTLPTLSDYAINLNDLDYYMTMIHGNLENYQKRIQKLESETSSHLNFLNHFSEVANEKYLQQVATDSATFRPGLPLMENLIRTIGSVSGIEQTQSNRTLNKTVALIGIGLIVSRIAATVLVEQLPPAKDMPFVFTSVFWGSISTGVIAVVIAFILLFRDRR